MVFKSDRQRKAFFATGNFKRSPSNPAMTGIAGRNAFSYKDGKNLGKFNSLQEVFKKFPSERKAFRTVMQFRKKSGIKVNSIKEIKMVKRTKKMVKSARPVRWNK